MSTTMAYSIRFFFQSDRTTTDGSRKVDDIVYISPTGCEYLTYGYIEYWLVLFTGADDDCSFTLHNATRDDITSFACQLTCLTCNELDRQ
jgi:hypothetical protein